MPLMQNASTLLMRAGRPPGECVDSTKNRRYVLCVDSSIKLLRHFSTQCTMIFLLLLS